MRTFKTKKRQRQEETARVIAHIVKESIEGLRAEEDKMRISIPVPQRFYCMEHKIYETPQDFNEEMERRTRASDYRNKVAYEKGREETAREIFQELKKEGIMYSHFAFNEHFAISMEKLKVIANKYGIKVEDVWEIEL